MHSAIDLRVVTHDLVAERERETLIDETYPLYLEAGRQLSPHLFNERTVAHPGGERTLAFLAAVERDALTVGPR